MVKAMSRGIFAGVDIGGTKTAIVLSSKPPTVLKRVMFPTLPAKGPKRAIDQIMASVHESLSSQCLGVNDLIAVGVSCGGPLDPLAGVIQSPPNLLSWKEVPIKALLEREFGVKTFLENDANAGALAEHQFGAGRGVNNLVFLTMGTGLGAGLILNGQLYRGSTHAAGEIGHVRLTRSGPNGYNKVGTAEGWASGAGMAKVARIALDKALEKGVATLLAQSNNSVAITAQTVWEAAQSGDAVAQTVVRTCGKRLGEAIAILIDILNPDRVVVGGLAVRMGEALLGPAREVVAKEALPSAYGMVEIVAAELGEDIGDVAALCVAMREVGEGSDS
jgi:glucokinase